MTRRQDLEIAGVDQHEAPGVPRGWTIATLGDFIEKIESGKSFKCDERPPTNTDIGVVKISAVTWGEYQELESKTCENPEFVDTRFFITKGDFLFSRANTIELVGACVIAKDVTRRIMLSDKILRIRFREISPEYVLHFLRTRSGRIQIEALSTGNQESMRNIGQERIKSIRVPVPPHSEQLRIISKIETLFSELDKGIEALKTARAQLKIYRQAVLKHAFEGKLTARWRAENQDKLETPDQILARIQKEREIRYQQQVEAWKRATKACEKAGVKEKPVKPSALSNIRQCDDPELAPLPFGWVWVEYAGLCERIRNGISEKPVGENGDKIFRISAVRPMEFVLDDIRYIDNRDHRFDDYYLKKGDLVFTRYNGSRAYVGVCAEYKGDGTHLFPDKLIQTRLGVTSVSPAFLEKAINCGESRRFIEQRIRTTAGQSGVSGSDVKSMPVPICSTDEQLEIIKYLSTELSRTDKMAEEIEATLASSEILRQSILKKAFSGQLVPQNPSDEPASALLARVRTGNPQQANGPSKVNRRKTSRTATGTR